jgi:hypothetical protein
MSTRSDIIAKCSDGKWRRIYCHSDGYLSHNGVILFEHYTDQNKIDGLMGLGDLSILGAELGKKIDFDWHNKAYKKLSDGKMTEKEYEALSKKMYGQCKAYGRDRGDKGTEADVNDSLAAVWPEEDTWTEFTYVWNGEKWLVGDPDEGTQTLQDLGEVLLGKKILTPKVKMFGGIILGQHKPHDPSSNGDFI